ncbi:polysaccharide biosynthesis tyrosine autokinase [Aeromonas hydrophila]|uniref:Tyrosine-protein kinase n=1 Tax=Aeromonas hydrophila subsp. hydrophila (strain ATCC 7966 / DSM 30187 / BCRC 13018 / CCUG 14551 / JCM 1027 / KCTC 2358 / NCIMB 9240 / NCTC 8049) TaxID=380703 RepID=A0KM80_AERHH|nr:polysaccharide biosynthesis tyrosine autokinase [Aeromonas hydrophila]ABK39311.1 tyrosine-protein kinase [Aeromonas hydrophila subsp. hydrophila ATCC 7966]MBS4672202.1 polysaccharide biosynthesis tyrosine autokinase [Aeromonas hydrophila]OOD36180.1 tyrosine-protein kinase [Aeromonas hydrophila]SUU30051.1 tyrosine-protein kinase [Aeromonas hydrophila]
MTTSSVSSRQSSAAVENDEIDLGRLLGYLIDGRWWIVTITALFMVLGVAYALLATPVFKANALLQVEKKASGAALLGDMADVLGGEQPDAAAEIELLTSRMVLGRTVQELHLDTVVSPDFFPLIGRGMSRLMGHPYPKMAVSRFEVAPELLGTPLTLTMNEEKRFTLEVEGRVLEGRVGELLEKDDVTLLLSDVAADEGQVFTLVKQPVLDVIAELQSGLQVSEKGKNTGIISLTLEGEDKGRIRAVLDNISQNYLQQNVVRKTEEAQKSLDFLQTHLPQVKEDLNRSEEQLNLYRQQNESVDLSLEAKAALDTMVGLEKQLNELTFREAELQQLYTRQHPAYIALMEKRQTLMNTKNAINKSIKRLPKTQQEILRLTRDVQVGQEIFVQLLNKQQELNIMKAGTIGNVRIIDDAAVETKAVKPKKPLIVVLATLLGGMLSVGLILVRAAFHRGVESPEQLEEMGLSVYATIPYSSEQATIEQQQKKRRHAMQLNEALLAARNPADLAMESLRSLRTSLHFAMMEAKNNIVMISGPGPGLGKTFVSTNFAATLALGGKKVLVIDADLRKGYMQKVMGQEMGAGLSSYLAGQTDLTQVVSQTGFDGLDFVCRGAVPPNPSELLMHPRFKALLDWASERYDFVIVDSPPILAVTDAAIVGQHVGASLLVARFAKTAVKEVEVAIRRFEQNGVSIKGILLNAVEKKASSYYGNYGYYQYSYGDKTKA